MRRRLAIAALALLAGGCSSLDWLNPFSASAERKARELPAIAAAIDVQLAWQGRSAESGRYSFAPAVVGASVYAAGADGTVVRYDEGREVWRIKAEQGLSAGVGADGQRVVVATPKGQVLAFDASGKPLWTAAVSSQVLDVPVVSDQLVVVRSGDNRVFGFDPTDGKRRWVYQRSTPALTLRGASGLALAERAVLAGFPGGKLVAINLANGAPLWETTVSLPRGATELERIADVVGPPVPAGRGACAASFQGRIACVELGGGEVQWAKEVSSAAGLDADGRGVFISDEQGGVRAYDRATGASVWRQDRLAARQPGRPLIVGDYVVVGDRQGAIHLLRREDGELVGRYVGDGSAVQADLVRGGDKTLVAQTARGGLFALRLP